MTERNSIKQKFGICAAIQEIAQNIVPFRHELHQIPEIGLEEFKTRDKLKEKLEEWGVEYEVLADTGIVVTVKGEQNTSGRTIGFRADMDGIKVKTPEDSGVEYKSLNPDMMHACGHDGHMASLLAAIRYLKDNRDFDGTLKFVFQPGEEGKGGAQKMIDAKLHEKHEIDAFYGFHNNPDHPIGTADVNDSSVMAGIARFNVTFQGEEGHTGNPEKANSPIYPAAKFITAIEKISKRLRNRSINKKVVVEFGNTNAGDASSLNIIPKENFLGGTIRTYSEKAGQNFIAKFKKAAEKIASKYGMTVDIDFPLTNPPTINDRLLSGVSKKALSAALGEYNLRLNPKPSTMSEDFGRNDKHTKICYTLAGNADPDNPDSPHSQNLHSTKYDFNDELIPIIAQSIANIVKLELPLADKAPDLSV